MNNSYNQKLRIGFIGAGFIGQLAHIDNFAQLKQCELVSISDLRNDLRESVASKYQIPNSFKNHKELLAYGNIDAVVVVTARQHTADIVEDCLKAGKHVFSEKPMAINTERASQLVLLAQSNSVYYCVGYMKRYDAGVQQAKSLIDQYKRTNELGSLLHIRASCYMGNSYCNANGNIESSEQRPQMQDEENLAPDWLTGQDRRYFTRYINVYSHITNLLDFLLNNPSYPNVEYFNFHSPLAHTCILNYGNCLATLETGEVTLRDWNEQCEFIFEHGILTLSLPPALLKNVPAKLELHQGGNNPMKIDYLQDWSWAFKNQAEAFINDIIHNNESSIDARIALRQIEIIEDIWRKNCK